MLQSASNHFEARKTGSSCFAKCWRVGGAVRRTYRKSKFQPRAYRSPTKSSVAGADRISILVAALVDTNILVYLFDPSEPTKQRVAAELLDRGLQEDSVRIPHQAI